MDPVIVTGRQTAEGNAGEGDRLGGHEVITLFVENLSENLHWKGLWFSFARHGEVVNVYIARKRSRGGKRFGFVRMKGLESAEWVMNRLHGFILYGSKLTVKRARNNFEWDRKRFSGSLPHIPGTMGNSVGTSLGHGEGLEASRLRRVSGDIAKVSMGNEKPKRITGHVEVEDLWRLRRCLVGVSDTICNVSSIHQRLVTWGLGKINVQRLGAKMFLLTIEDEKLFLMLEDVNWSYLKEIFKEVTPWSEKFSYTERATWIEIRGLPLHCWNNVTLKKIAELWGTFEALGANFKHSLDCEKVTVLIATNQARRIEEIVEILEVSEKSDESTGVSIPSAEKRLEVESVDRSRPGTEAEVLQSLWAERNCINDDSREMEAFRGKVNFLELMGGECNDLSGVNGVERGMGEIRVWNGGIEGNGVAEEANINPTHEQLGGELGRELTKVQGPDFELISDVLHHSGPQGIRVEVGPAACSMGPLGIEDYLGGADVIPSHNQKLSWVDIVSGKENSGLLVSKDLVDGKITEHGSDRGFIVDFDEDKVNRKKRKAKKYGSILDIQNQSISEFERRRRDKALKKRSWSKEQLEDTKLSGKSLSDSDINNRVSVIVKEVR
ncbi:hypothetical protein V6N13_098738 [Hibiscus sabdariffa]